MELELRINDSKYFIKITSFFNKNGELKFNSSLQGTTISTFNYRADYLGNTIDESVSKIAHELNRAIKELLEL